MLPLKGIAWHSAEDQNKTKQGHQRERKGFNKTRAVISIQVILHQKSPQGKVLQHLKTLPKSEERIHRTD